MRDITVKALLENIRTVTDFVDNFLEDYLCPVKTQMQIDIALDEILSNIVYYAYGDETGDVTVSCEAEERNDNTIVSISFIDSGIEYDPLKNEDPDVSLSLEERKIGGLGIFLVKKMMDDFTYRYENNMNISTITVSWRK